MTEMNLKPVDRDTLKCPMTKEPCMKDKCRFMQDGTETRIILGVPSVRQVRVCQFDIMFGELMQIKAVLMAMMNPQASAPPGKRIPPGNIFRGN